jgi:hypothetical protein
LADAERIEHLHIKAFEKRMRSEIIRVMHFSIDSRAIS